ncbi:hypothetical protein EVAR_21614_1 [Eumeta japonica]|uniref:Uncharacterized protein n=1 Tax=Eumeta variegata TaxID=151549 RepID=A0A4C1UYS3_EUMVA|nr:hypothetical protein EVAR_21614_1 [Eumeta japonica]
MLTRFKEEATNLVWDIVSVTTSDVGPKRKGALCTRFQLNPQAQRGSAPAGGVLIIHCIAPGASQTRGERPNPTVGIQR